MVPVPTRRLAVAALLVLGFAASGSACGGEGGTQRESEGRPVEAGQPPSPATAPSDRPTASGRVGSSPPSTRCEDLGAVLDGIASASGPVCRVTFPRRDLTVSLLGATLPPGMGLTSWAAFAPAPERDAIVMGDLALTADELPAVMGALRNHGLRATAVHRHMVGERPAMSFMHYLGVGPADSLARALAAALDAAPSARGTTGAEASGAAGTGRSGSVTGTACAEIAGILGAEAGSADAGPGYCKVSLPRSDLDVRVEGIPVPASLGIGSWFAFRETDDGGAAVAAGDMALTEGQVNPAIATLRERGIEVVALHNHMLFDEPRVMFFHFQARGAPGELARGLAAGLEAAGLGAASGPADDEGPGR